MATNQEELNEETERNQKRLRNFRTSLTKLYFKLKGLDKSVF